MSTTAPDPDLLSAEDERAIKRLIRLYTAKRDFEIVEALFFDLGIGWEKVEKSKPTHLGTGERKNGVSANSRALAAKVEDDE
jgi:hypothetical protein